MKKRMFILRVRKMKLRESGKLPKVPSEQLDEAVCKLMSVRGQNPEAFLSHTLSVVLFSNHTMSWVSDGRQVSNQRYSMVRLLRQRCEHWERTSSSDCLRDSFLEQVSPEPTEPDTAEGEANAERSCVKVQRVALWGLQMALSAWNTVQCAEADELGVWRLPPQSAFMMCTDV